MSLKAEALKIIKDTIDECEVVDENRFTATLLSRFIRNNIIDRIEKMIAHDEDEPNILYSDSIMLNTDVSLRNRAAVMVNANDIKCIQYTKFVGTDDYLIIDFDISNEDMLTIRYFLERSMSEYVAEWKILDC